MKRSKKKKRPAQTAAPAPAPAPEDQTILAVTVLWMLTVFSALAANLAAILGVVLARGPAESAAPSPSRMATAALLTAALVTGLLCLALTPLVWRMRPVKPPLPIVLIAVLVGMAPIVTLVVLWLFFA